VNLLHDGEALVRLTMDYLGGHMRRAAAIVVLVGSLVLLAASLLATPADDRAELLSAREAVWRAWFANDTKALEALVPTGTIVISSGEEKWKDQAGVLQDAAKFQASGGKLIRLEFPRTEVQRFGDVAITYSRYLYEIEVDGKRSLTSGRVTEIFVRHKGKWTNPGWHTDTEK
jgi:hypothetical protein